MRPDGINLVVVQRPSIRIGMDVTPLPKTGTVGSQAEQSCPFGTDPNPAAGILLESIDHSGRRRQFENGTPRGIVGDQLAVARTDPHAAAAIFHQSPDFAHQLRRPAARIGQRKDLGRLAQNHGPAQTALVISRKPQHVVVHVEAHDGVGHLTIGTLGIVEKRLDAIVFPVIVTETVIVHLDPKAPAALGDMGQRIDVIGNRIRLLLEVLVIVRSRIVTRDAGSGRGNPHDAMRIDIEFADARKPGALGRQQHEPVVGDPIQLAGATAYVDPPINLIESHAGQLGTRTGQLCHGSAIAADPNERRTRERVNTLAIGIESSNGFPHTENSAHGIGSRGSNQVDRPVLGGDPGIILPVDEQCGDFAAQSLGIEERIGLHGRSIARTGKPHDAHAGNRHPSAAPAVVPAKKRGNAWNRHPRSVRPRPRIARYIYSTGRGANCR